MAQSGERPTPDISSGCDLEAVRSSADPAWDSLPLSVPLPTRSLKINLKVLKRLRTQNRLLNSRLVILNTKICIFLKYTATICLKASFFFNAYLREKEKVQVGEGQETERENPTQASSFRGLVV